MICFSSYVSGWPHALQLRVCPNGRPRVKADQHFRHYDLVNPGSDVTCCHCGSGARYCHEEKAISVLMLSRKGYLCLLLFVLTDNVTSLIRNSYFIVN